MHKSLFVSLFLILFVAGSEVYSQPATVVNFVGGYLAPLADMKGSFGDTPETFTVNADSNTYFLKNGINFGLNVKHSPFKDKKLKIVGGISYNSFSRDREYPDWENPVNIELRQRIFTVSLGAEFQYFTRTSRVNPFAGFELTANLFSGSYTENYYVGDPNILTLKPASRLGIQLGAGIDFALGKRLGVVTGFKYNFANLIGKNTTGDTGKEYGLNDKEAEVRGVKYLTKNIQYLQIYAGVAVFLGL